MLQKLIDARRLAVEPKIDARGPARRACEFASQVHSSRPRSDIQAAIEAAGGIFDKTVKKGTDYLVAGADVGATKLKDAQKKGVQVIDEAALEKLLRGGVA